MEKETTNKKRKEIADNNDLIKKQQAHLGKAMVVFEKHYKRMEKNLEEPTFEEEKVYKRKVQWLKDHGNSNSDDNDNTNSDSNESS